MMSRSRILQNSLPPLILVLSLLTIYLSTVAPGLTWANGGSDGGDLIAAAATGGIAHPTGYPLYLLVARLFQFLPVGSLAFRTNLLSATATALAAALVYALVTRSSSGSGVARAWPAGMAAGYAFGLAPLIWSQALITEVYGLHALLLALILYLYTTPAPTSSSNPKRLDYLRGLVLGLAVCNHITAIFLVPVALLLGSIHSQPELEGPPPSERRSLFGNLKLNGRALLRQLGMFGAGLSLYLILPLRALMNPPINWGRVVTPERFWWLVSGQLYQSYYMQSTLPEIWARIQAWAALLFQQFGLAGILLGLIGLVIFGTSSRLSILMGWMAAIYTAFAIFYGSADSYVYLIPTFLSFAIWIGLGSAGLVKGLSPRLPILGLGLGLILMGYFVARSATQVNDVDASADLRAESFGREVLSAVPEDALIFAKGDRAVFTLWYYHFALRERPDLAVIAADLLHFDWYQENLQSTYPALAVPGPFPWPGTIAAANPLKPACYVQYADADQPKIECAEALEAP